MTLNAIGRRAKTIKAASLSDSELRYHLRQLNLPIVLEYSPASVMDDDAATLSMCDADRWTCRDGRMSRASHGNDEQELRVIDGTLGGRNTQQATRA